MSSDGFGSVFAREAAKVAFDAGDDAGVAGHFGVPAACFGVVAQGAHVVELGLELGPEVGGGDEVVALLADVGVRAGFGGQVAGAVAVGDSGFEQLAAEPLNAVGARRACRR
jgi:hypothetical protein